jgi:hypothetical protein
MIRPGASDTGLSRDRRMAKNPARAGQPTFVAARTPRDGNGLPYGFRPHQNRKGSQLAKPNYAFAKRQRDLAKQQKKEEKRKKKAEPGDAPPAATDPAAPAEEKPAS